MFTYMSNPRFEFFPHFFSLSFSLHLKSKETDQTLLIYFLHMYMHHCFKFT